MQDITEKITNVFPAEMSDPLFGIAEEFNVRVCGEGYMDVDIVNSLQSFISSRFLLVRFCGTEADVQHNDQSYHCGDNTMFMFAPFTHYTVSFSNHAEKSCIYVSFEITPHVRRGWLKDMILSNGVGYLSDEYFIKIGAGLDGLLKPECRYQYGHSATVGLYISLLIIRIIKYQVADSEGEMIHYEENDSVRIINDAIDYVDGHLAERIDVKKIAGHIGVSESALYKTFRKVTQVAPSTYFTRFKMRKACEMLKHNEPVKKIAVNLGYSSASHFCSTFKNVFGYSTASYKKIYKND
ncbi:MAG: AraC family transcriptional regulator [Eubacteriaceae bacterium]|jgi:AraC-like DNA-binding protein|nr:AraC family transcriptional regulator [Eubacteriaceae bacterium]